MIENLKAKIVAAAKQQKIWTGLYNRSCRKCQVKMVTMARNPKEVGTAGAVDAMADFMDNHLCDKCRKIYKTTLENASN